MIAGTTAGWIFKESFNTWGNGNHIIMIVIEYIMKFAPIGVVCFMANITESIANDILTGLAKMLAAQYTAYATLVLAVFPFILAVYSNK